MSSWGTAWSTGPTAGNTQSPTADLRAHFHGHCSKSPIDLEAASCLLQASVSIAASWVLIYKLILGSSLRWTFQQQPWVTCDARSTNSSLLHTQFKHQGHFYSLFLTTFPDTLSGDGNASCNEWPPWSLPITDLKSPVGEKLSDGCKSQKTTFSQAASVPKIHLTCLVFGKEFILKHSQKE